MAHAPIVEGTVRNVEHGREPPASGQQKGIEYLSFVVIERRDGADVRQLEVEMRAREIAGTVRDNDIVQVFGKLDVNRRVIADEIVNVDTGAITRPKTEIPWNIIGCGVVLIIIVIIILVVIANL